jgi:hypothetical protein
MKRLTTDQAENILLETGEFTKEDPAFRHATEIFKFGYNYLQVEIEYSKLKYIFLSVLLFIIRMAIIAASFFIFNFLLHFSEEGTVVISVVITIMLTSDTDTAMRYFHITENKKQEHNK